ncbi:winged helix-turn-helix domain-containing protein [Streptomyces sp. NPDC059922]|uniref:winged helix-turn-helix domain-containing protein n=1 Tax=Streptomyces sp. NPDC059922 TaxID=3347005 RepID=UPI0036684F14
MPSHAVHGSGVPWGSTVAPRPWQGRAEADGAHRSGRECGRGRRGRSRRVRSRVHRSRYPPAWLADYRQPPDDPRPPYVRTADALRKQIQDGRLAPGAKLPCARDLQAQYGIANSTAQNALRVLKEEGLVYSVQGRGVFVRQVSPRDQFLKRYNETLEEMTAQRRADEEAVRPAARVTTKWPPNSLPPRNDSPRPAPSSKPPPPTATPCVP